MSLTAEMERLLALGFPTDALDIALGTYTFRNAENQDLLLRLLDKACKKRPEIIGYQAFQNYFNSALQGASSPVGRKRTLRARCLLYQ